MQAIYYIGERITVVLSLYLYKKAMCITNTLNNTIIKGNMALPRVQNWYSTNYKPRYSLFWLTPIRSLAHSGSRSLSPLALFPQNKLRLFRYSEGFQAALMSILRKDTVSGCSDILAAKRLICQRLPLRCCIRKLIS